MLITSTGLAQARAGDWPFKSKAKPGEPATLEQIARSIDCIEEKVRDDGTVVLKRPDVYGQARMTLYRKNFEQQLYAAIGNFNDIISARVSRSDTATLTSQTALQASLAGSTSSPGSSSKPTVSPSSSSTVVNTPPATTGGSTPGGSTPSGSSSGPGIPQLPTIPTNVPIPTGSGLSLSATNPFGLEPTIHLDELANYQNHLNQLRRVNMGDDVADSAGYGLYLIRMPISIQPGECTVKGHGAVVTVTARHDFGPDFLYTTYRNLAINDLVDQIGPILYEMIRSGVLNAPHAAPTAKQPASGRSMEKAYLLSNVQMKYSIFGNTANISQPLRSNDPQKMPVPLPQNPPSAPSVIEKSTINRLGTNRINERDYPIPPTDYDDVFLTENLFMLAINAQAAGQTSEPRATDVRAFLRRELESAYDIVSQLYRDNDPESFQIRQAFEDGVEKIARSIRGQDYRQLADLYQDLANNLPGKLNAGRDGHRDSINNPLNNVLTILCYAIAVESGLLDEQLRLDMKRVLGKGGANCAEIDTMRFYPRSTPPEVQAKFQEYVVKRWPLITFALDPQVDQQNIDDVTNVSRDLQLALSFAFSTGQIGFNQLITYQRQLTFAAEAIALNRTVTSFAHGDDTFGFRFMPRYQTPPQESSNISAIVNQLVKGGPGRNYQLKNSKLEAGQRELTAIVIMPSFLQGIEMDVTGNWFPLHDPDQMKTPTPRMIEQGRKVVELRDALACIHDHKSYRPGDIRRLETRVHQLEVMLPMQTHEVRVPYENTLGGFQLFQEGTTSLVPHLDGFQGADSIAAGQETDLVIFGKHFSVQETRVVIGGSSLLPVELDPSASAQQSGQSTGSGNSAAPAASQTSPSTGTGNAATPTVTQTTTKQTAQSPSTGSNTGASPSPAATPAGNPNVDVISREVLRISIPSGVQATNILDADGKTRPYVEVYVATPNGISNRLLIPYKPTATATPATPPGYTVSNNLALVYKGEVSFGGKNVEFIPPLTFEPQLQDNTLLIGLGSDSGIVPASIKAVFKMTLPNGKDSEPITISNIPYVAGSQGYLINDVAGKMNFTALANGISGLKEFNQFFPVTSPNPALTTGLTPTLTATLTAKVTLTPENMPGNIAIGGDQAASNTLTINVTINVLPPVPAPPKPGAGGGAGNARNLVLPPVSSARPRSVAPMARVQESGRDAALKRSTYRPAASASLPPLPAMPPAPATSKQASPKRAAAAPVDDKDATKGGRWPWSKR